MGTEMRTRTTNKGCSKETEQTYSHKILKNKWAIIRPFVYIRPIFPVSNRHIAPNVQTAIINMTAIIKRCTGVIPNNLPLVLRRGESDICTTSSGGTVSSS